jgi:hypothetical protein
MHLIFNFIWGIYWIVLVSSILLEQRFYLIIGPIFLPVPPKWEEVNISVISQTHLSKNKLIHTMGVLLVHTVVYIICKLLAFRTNWIYVNIRLQKRSPRNLWHFFSWECIGLRKYISISLAAADGILVLK